MEFDKSKVYTAVNADELKVGSKVICATCLANLKEYVADYFNRGVENTCIITSILDDAYGDRFEIGKYHAPLAYLISESEEKKLKWTDLKIGDIVRYKAGKVEHIVTGIHYDDGAVFFGGEWARDKELESWEKVE